MIVRPSNAVPVFTALILALPAMGVAQTSARSAEPVVGQPAPAFSVVDTKGKTQSLAAQRGKWVVLEWFSHGCPFTAKQYNSNTMQNLQRQYTAKGVVWLSVVSSAPGKDGFMSVDETNKRAVTERVASTAIVRDTAGTLGHLYGARNTPQLFVIDPKGVLRYAGAIDDKPTTRLEDIPIAHNYLRAALDEGLAGKAISIPRTQPYGCTVQY
jgi:alkyl hydroperoxide reductase subunit AhpC